MVKALIDISGEANRVLNIVKAKYGLKDKSAAINRMAEEYEKEILEPQLRPQYDGGSKRSAKKKHGHSRH